MRLRRETGDFDIVLTSDNSYTAQLNKRVSAEDLIGHVAKVDGVYNIVTTAADSSDKATATVTIGEDTYTYTRETGVLAKAAG